MTRLGDIVDLEDADEALASRAIEGIASDSRKIQPGYAFFAVAGTKDETAENTKGKFSAYPCQCVNWGRLVD